MLYTSKDVYKYRLIFIVHQLISTASDDHTVVTCRHVMSSAVREIQGDVTNDLRVSVINLKEHMVIISLQNGRS